MFTLTTLWSLCVIIQNTLSTYMYVEGFSIIQWTNRWIHCKKRVFRNTTSCCNTAATDFGVWKHNFVAFWNTTSVLKSSVWLFESRLIKFEKTISRVLINCNWCFETPYSDNPIPILIFQSTVDQVLNPQCGCLSHGWSSLKKLWVEFWLTAIGVLKHRIRITESLSWSFNPRLTRFWILSVVVWATADQVWKNYK